MSKSMTQTPVNNHTAGQEKPKNTSKGWSKIPNEVVRDTRLSAIDFRLFCDLDARQGQKMYQDIRRETLAKDLGVSKSTISRSFKKLQELGYLDLLLRRYASRYYLKNPARSREAVAPMTPPLVTHDTATDKELLDKEPKQEQALKALAVVAVEGEVTNKTYTETALKVITAETGVKLAINEKTLKACSRAQKLGFDNPHLYGLAVAKHYQSEASKKVIKSSSGFIVSVSMVAILEGETNQENKPTPIPPKYDPNEPLDLCPIHADQGHLRQACPPCRQAEQNFAREQENYLSVVSL